MTDEKNKWVVGVTGASGTIYALRLIEELIKTSAKIDLIFSKTARVIIRHENSVEEFNKLEDIVKTDNINAEVNIYDENDFFAPCASGSNIYDAMIIIPASTGTISRVACGISDNLITRTAEVFLKEKRRLIIVPRETPVSSAHLKNLWQLSEWGAVVMPASPAFYTHPRTIDDCINFITGRILDQLGVEHNLLERWQEG